MCQTPRLFTRSHSCLSIASSLLSHPFPWSCYDAGFWLFILYSVVAEFTSSFVSVMLHLSYFLHFAVCFLVFLYLSRFVGMQFGRFLRAGLSSNGSSEPLSDSLSKLSSHQIPRCLVSEGTTTAKGLYGNSFFDFNHYAFGGVCATSALCALALHFGFGAEQACSAAARVTSSLPISGLPFVLR